MSGAAGEPAGELSFEQALRQLEERVQKLESGDLSLDDALRHFEEGVALVRQCHERLDAADARIVTLSRSADGAPQERASQDRNLE